mgnify:CR=1 FL=1
MRGKALTPLLMCTTTRITPAYAGKSLRASPPCTTTWDHPRVCGEKSVWHFQLRPVVGSPPRMRGKDDRPCAYDHTDRITPAYAGKSTRLSLFAIFSGDHPRVCGEKIACGHYMLCYSGSPPRVRGKADPKKHRQRQTGITPACAGKRAMDALPSFPAGDHPRVCGEKAPRHLALCCILGSPPRVRGKARHLVRGAVKRGITPACAGKREPPPAFRACGRDHPRVCGEKRAARRAAAGRAGSPPRVRGKVNDIRFRKTNSGITPACAGKSTKQEKQQGKARDHPRVCGEKVVFAGLGEQLPGSPPRVRGKVEKGLKKPLKCGITPACAGKRSQ